MSPDNIPQIRSVYGELQGYLSQIPLPKDPYETAHNVELANLIDNAIINLNSITGLDYNRFKIHREQSEIGEFVRILEYRTKLGGLISSIHATFFADEQAPFSGSPSTVITQQQQQATYVSMLLEVQDKLNEKIQSATDENEKNFLQQVKAGLNTVKNTAELIALIITTAQTCGISLSKLADLFR